MPSSYRGFDVLEDEPEHGLDEKAQRRFEVLGGSTGARSSYSQDSFPAWQRTIRWHMFGELDVSTFRAFIDARAGRAVPVWIPSFEQDLEASATILSAFSTFSAYRRGYSNVFALGLPRRHLYILNTATRVSTALKVIGVTDNGDGTDTITLEAAPGFGIGLNFAMLSLLRLCRLDADRPTIHWASKGYAYADLPFVELPLEVPA